MSENWRLTGESGQDAGDYFLHQKKRVQLEQRRPSIRRASDLVGPGIGASAVRITNYDDLLATYDGYYSSAPGALSAPNSTDSFVGFVVMDDEFGGTQQFTSMVSGNVYTRLFRRNPSDPASVSFTAWSWTNAPAIEPTASLPREMAYAERSTSFTTTNTGIYGASGVIPNLAVTVVGEGKPVEIVVDLPTVYTTVANATVGAYILSNAQSTTLPGGYLAFVGTQAANVQRAISLRRRFVLVNGTSYALTVGLYANAAMTTGLTLSTNYPASISVNRLD